MKQAMQNLKYAQRKIHTFIHRQYKHRIKPDETSFGYVFIWNIQTGEITDSSIHSFDTMTVNHIFVPVIIRNWGHEPETYTHTSTFNDMIRKFNKYHGLESLPFTKVQILTENDISKGLTILDGNENSTILFYNTQEES